MWRVLRWPALIVAVFVVSAALSHSPGLIVMLPLLLLWWVPVQPQIPLDLDYELQFLLDD